ncbi:MAG: hypothetical protein WAV43_04740 [Streptococcus parauberis]|jgi:hypothetical protein
MKLDLTIQELEFIFDNLPSVSEFEIQKEIEFRKSNVKLTDLEFKAYVDSYRLLRNKILESVSKKY